MGNQESYSPNVPQKTGINTQNTQRQEQWMNLEKKGSEKTERHRRRPKGEEKWVNIENKGREKETKTGEIKYVIRKSYIQKEDDTTDSSQSDVQNEGNDAHVRYREVKIAESESPEKEKNINYVIRRSYIRADDSDSNHDVICSRQNDFQCDKSDALTSNINNTHREIGKKRDDATDDSRRDIEDDARVEPSLRNKKRYHHNDSNITVTKCDVHLTVNEPTREKPETTTNLGDDSEKSFENNECDNNNNKEVLQLSEGLSEYQTIIRNKNITKHDIIPADQSTSSDNECDNNNIETSSESLAEYQTIIRNKNITEHDKIPADQSTSSDLNTTTPDNTPCDTTIDTSFESKADNTGDTSDGSTDSDDSTETFHLMTIRRIDLNPIVCGNINSTKSTSLPNMANSSLPMLRPKPVTEERKLKCRTLPIVGQRTRNASYDNVRYYSSLETVLEDNGDNCHQVNETECTQNNAEDQVQEYDENYLSDHYDNVSLDSLTKRPKISYQNGNVNIYNKTDDNKIQKELIDRHRKMWLYKYNYEDLSKTRDRCQRPRGGGYYRSTSSLDGYLNRYRPMGYNHGCMSLSYDVLNRSYNHSGYVNRDGVFVSHERQPYWKMNDDPGNTSDSSMSTVDTDSHFVKPSTVIRPSSYDYLSSEADVNRCDQVIGDITMLDYDMADPLYTSIEEPGQLQNEELYQEVSEVRAQNTADHSNTIKTFQERTSNVNSHGPSKDDLTSVNGTLRDYGMKSGNETDMENCCGCSSNTKVKSRSPVILIEKNTRKINQNDIFLDYNEYDHIIIF